MVQKTKQIAVSLTEDKIKELQHKAELEGRSLSNLVSYILKNSEVSQVA